MLQMNSSGKCMPGIFDEKQPPLFMLFLGMLTSIKYVRACGW